MADPLFSMQAPPIAVDKGSDTPIYQQIYESVRTSIEAGVLRPGDKLPSIRTLSAGLKIARNTVDNAYKQLIVEGYVASRQGSGFIVQEISRDALAELPTPKTRVQLPKRRVEPARNYRFDLSYGNLTTDAFPMSTWRRIAADVFSDANAEKMASYGDPFGERQLRLQIARHVALTRSVQCTPEQILITSGTEQSLNVVLGMFDAERDAVAIEDPGYAGVRAALQHTNFDARRIRTHEGEDAYLADVKASGARLVYTTPSHQFPLGWCMSQRVRSVLLEHAVKHDAYLVEDDYDSAYRYTTQPVPSLRSKDRWGRVIYLGTFSKILSPALRIGYIVLPVELLDRYEQRYRGTHPTVSWADQTIVATFMEQGHWDKHLRRIVNLYRKRHEALTCALARTFGSHIAMHDGAAGLFTAFDIDNGMTQEELVSSARSAGVRIANSKELWLRKSDAPENLVVLGFSAVDEAGAEQAVELLGDAWLQG